MTLEGNVLHLGTWIRQHRFTYQGFFLLAYFSRVNSLPLGFREDTLAETNSSPLKIDPWKFGDSYYYKPPFLGDMLVWGRITSQKKRSDHPKLDIRVLRWQIFFDKKKTNPCTYGWIIRSFLTSGVLYLQNGIENLDFSTDPSYKANWH